MPVSPSLTGTADARGFLEHALSTANGAKIIFDSKTRAYAFKQRCFNVRSTERRASRKVYAPGEPGHGETAFDAISLYDGPEVKGHCPQCQGTFDRWAVFAVKNMGMQEIADVVDL